MNYARFLNKIALQRAASPIRILTSIVQQSPPSLITMAGGMPNTQTFPVVEGLFKLRDGSELKLDEKLMSQALQYSATPGFPGLLEFIYHLQFRVHNPPLFNATDSHGQMECIVTNGSQDGLCKVFEAMVSDGDRVLVEHPCYSGTLALARPLTSNLLPVKIDKDGLDPEHLEQVLSKWTPEEVKQPDSKAPKLLYLVPNGGNPTGSCLTLERKKRIYEIARLYDLIIIEDDPYFYLQFEKPYIPSFLSMDEDGRVVRLDSLSKLVSSGVRIGFVTGPRPIIDRVLLHVQCSSMHASGLAQALIQQLFQRWGYDGFLEHAEKTAEFYKNQRDLCIEAAEKHLKGLAEWSVPTGGMFLWLKLNVEDTFNMITVKARAKEILFVPGSAFLINDSATSPYIRASYSSVSGEKMNIAFSRLAELIREEC